MKLASESYEIKNEDKELHAISVIYDCETMSETLSLTEQGALPTRIRIFSQGDLVFNGELDNARLAIV